MAHPTPAVDRPLKPLGPGTLGRRLVLRVAALVAGMAIVLSTLTTLATTQLLIGDLDRQLQQAFNAQPHEPHGSGGDTPRGVARPGLPLGTVVTVSNGTVAAGGMVTQSGPETLPPDTTKQMLQLPDDGRRVSMTLPSVGRYRLMSVELNGSTYVVGFSLERTDRLIASLVGMEIVLSLIAVAAAVSIAREVVIRSLRPLNRVAATAREVSGLQLAQGEVALPVRVDAQDANPANEVGKVGYALNHLLSNVEGALAARQASETKVRQFVADASHELRNPLAAIRGYAELTRRHRDELPPDTGFALNRIDAEAERMSRLVEDMLLLARLDSNADLRLEDVDLTELVLNAVSDARAAGPAYHWQMDLAPEPVIVTADRNRVHQVLVNLLANARTHTPEGTTVRVGVRPAGQWAEITVADNGPGIPSEIVNHVFERFTRADSGRTRHGKGKDSTGLGLAIVAAVMDAHHGNASVSSRPGNTTFTLRFRSQGPGEGQSALA